MRAGIHEAIFIQYKVWNRSQKRALEVRIGHNFALSGSRAVAGAAAIANCSLQFANYVKVSTLLPLPVTKQSINTHTCIHVYIVFNT